MGGTSEPVGMPILNGGPQGLSSAAILPGQKPTSTDVAATDVARRLLREKYVCARPRWIRTTSAEEPVLGRWKKKRCMSRRCRGCAMTMAIWDRDFIEGGLQHQLKEKLCTFITVAEPRAARGFADSGAALTSFIKSLHRSVGIRKGTGLSWVGVGELGEKSKHLHWHLLVSGLAYPWCGKLDAPERESLLRATASGKLTRPGDVVTDRWGRSAIAVSKNGIKHLVAEAGFGTGFIGLRHVRTMGTDITGVGSYMSKYLSKGDAGEDLPKGFQLVRSSRGNNAWFPGQTLLSIRDAHKVAFRERKSASRAESAQRIATATLDDSGAFSTLTLLPGGA